MTIAEDKYREYKNEGGLQGICNQIVSILSKSWTEFDTVKKLFEEAVKIYQQAFPTGRPPRDPAEAIRRRSIFAAVYTRLSTTRSPRAAQLEPLYREYMRVTWIMMQYRDALTFLSTNYRDYYEDMTNSLKGSPSVDTIFDVIRRFYNITSEVRGILSSDYPDTKDLIDIIERKFSLGTLWFKFTYALTAETGDEYWITRSLEIHVSTETHAELLFHTVTDERLSEVVMTIFEVTDNSWLLNFSELRGFPFEFESKQLLGFRSGILSDEVEFSFTLFDHNYGIERIKIDCTIPWNWQTMKAEDIVDYIERRCGIEVTVIRGTTGRRKKGEVPMLERKFRIVEGKKVEYLQVTGVLSEGEVKPISGEKKVIKKE